MKSHTYMKQLDGLRFLAVAAVMFGHYTSGIPYLATFDEYITPAGVNLFFVLSGFLITEILITNGQENKSKLHVLKIFYIRRFLRIFPLYYGVLFCCLALNVHYARDHMFSLLTYTANYAIALSKGEFGFLTHLWSLSVEEQFYIFFPLILLTAKRFHLKLFLSLVVIAIAFRCAVFFLIQDKLTALWTSYAFTPGCFDCFAVGAILAHYKVNKPAALKNILDKKWIFAGSLMISIALFILPYNLGSAAVGRLSFSIFCFWAIGRSSLREFDGIVGKIMELQPVAYLARISYGMYVYHNLVPQILGHLNIRYEIFVWIPGTIILSMVSWHIFELPINNMKKYFQYNAQSSVPGTAVRPVNRGT